LASVELPIEIDENAQIEIVAPVLRKGKTRWKGIYNEEFINFFMDDPIYNDAVLAKQISFKSGDVITCVLEIHRELNGELDWEFSLKMQNYITDELQMRAVKIIFGSLNIQLLRELKKKK
jgi:hypothetical protein